MTDPKQTFVHDFANGNRCVLTLDYTADPPNVATWKTLPSNEERQELFVEYNLWSILVAKKYADLLNDEQLAILATKTYSKNKTL
jgi:hypothetical protein